MPSPQQTQKCAREGRRCRSCQCTDTNNAGPKDCPRVLLQISENVFGSDMYVGQVVLTAMIWRKKKKKAPARPCDPARFTNICANIASVASKTQKKPGWHHLICKVVIDAFRILSFLLYPTNFTQSTVQFLLDLGSTKVFPSSGAEVRYSPACSLFASSTSTTRKTAT